MFKKIKNLILKFLWFCLPGLNSSGKKFSFPKLLDLSYQFLHDILSFILPFYFFFKYFFFDLKFLIGKYFNLF